MFVYKEPDYMAKLGKAEEDDYITGDRMATFMLYLSEVSDIRVASSLTKVTQDRIWCCFDETS